LHHAVGPAIDYFGRGEQASLRIIVDQSIEAAVSAAERCPASRRRRSARLPRRCNAPPATIARE
jgi:hypothetical protein